MSFFLFFILFSPFSVKKSLTKCILSSQACRRGRRYLSQQFECWKGTISKGQRIKSHESILLCAFCCCLFESICFADIFPMRLEMLFPLIASAIDVQRSLYSEVHHRQRGVTASNSALRIKGMSHLYLPALQPCLTGTGLLQGMSWQTENKLLLTKGTPLFLLHESSGIPCCDTSSLGMEAKEVWQVCCWYRALITAGNSCKVLKLERTAASLARGLHWVVMLVRVHCFLHWPRLLVPSLPTETYPLNLRQLSICWLQGFNKWCMFIQKLSK